MDSVPMEIDLGGLPPNLYAGTSSWSSPDWEGVFYPPGTRPTETIAEYGKRLRTVEIDSSFYGCPSRSTVEGWAGKTPPGFVFSAKVPQAITHEKYLEGCEEETDRFLGAMSRLGEKLGPLVFQFAYVPKGKDEAEYRTGSDFRRRLAAYLERLPRDFRYAVEVRNAGWIDRDLLDLLKGHRAALVLADYHTMPSLERIEERLDPLTTDFTLIRFLGNRKQMDDLLARKRREEGKKRDFDELIVDRTPEMRCWVPALRWLVPRTERAYAYFNNHYGGFGPGSLALFARVWREAGL